uniref:Uncharacterized protein n=1 Tax=Cucumis melo TaxID=3656 RepID=A0A9I9EBU5_CUCME
MANTSASLHLSAIRFPIILQALSSEGDASPRDLRVQAAALIKDFCKTKTTYLFNISTVAMIHFVEHHGCCIIQIKIAFLVIVEVFETLCIQVHSLSKTT